MCSTTATKANNSNNDNRYEGTVTVPNGTDDAGPDEGTPLIRVSFADDDNNKDSIIDQMNALNYARILLYVSHLFAQLSESAWQFALLLFLAAVTNYQSMTLVSTYGLIANLFVLVFGSTTGHFTDTSTNRLTTARIFIWSENVCVIVASMLCYILLRSKENAVLLAEQNEDHQYDASVIPTDFFSITILVGLHLFGPVAQILDGGFLVAIERDWVVVMGQVATKLQLQQQKKKYATSSVSGNNASKSTNNNIWLTETNVAMKQIDLSCKVLSPAVAGWVVDVFGKNHLSKGALIISALNVASLLAEYICTARIYHLIPELAIVSAKIATHDKRNSKERDEKGDDDTNERYNNTIEANGNSSNGYERKTTARCRRCCNGVTEFYHALVVYFEQIVSPAGLGSALLYLNSLTFGGLMVSYLLYRGMDMSTVGLWRGISAGIGLIGTFFYSVSVRHFSIISTGMWSILYQFAFITFSMVSMFVQDYVTSMTLMIFGVSMSRIGLYVFKISVTQLNQLYIPEGIRGSVGGTQNSLNAFFQLSAFALCLVFSNPKDFVVVVGAGYCSVAIASILYAFGIYFRSDKLMSDLTTNHRSINVGI